MNIKYISISFFCAGILILVSVANVSAFRAVHPDGSFEKISECYQKIQRRPMRLIELIKKQNVDFRLVDDDGSIDEVDFFYSLIDNQWLPGKFLPFVLFFFYMMILGLYMVFYQIYKYFDLYTPYQQA